MLCAKRRRWTQWHTVACAMFATALKFVSSLSLRLILFLVCIVHMLVPLVRARCLMHFIHRMCVCVCVCVRVCVCARVCVRVHTQASWQTQSSRGQTACCGCGTAPAFYQTGYRLMKSGHLPKYICALRHSHTPAPVRPLARARTRTRMRTLTAFPCACGHVRRYNAFGKSGGEYPPEAGADACWESQRAMQRGKTKTSMGVRASGEH